MKIIEIVGPGCNDHLDTIRRVAAGIAAADCEAVVVSISDFKLMIERNVFATPAVLINGRLRLVGQVPDIADIVDWLKTSTDKGIT